MNQGESYQDREKFIADDIDPAEAMNDSSQLDNISELQSRTDTQSEVSELTVYV
jgi:hypothetical protein